MKYNSNQISDRILESQIKLYDRLYSMLLNETEELSDARLSLLTELVIELEAKIQIGIRELKTRETYSNYKRNEGRRDYEFKGTMMLNLS